ncbi:MAG: META domain-containing protein [Acidobacteriota bacterium]|nr:META domain-containing protein [Acidobacteriota bacterium]
MSNKIKSNRFLVVVLTAIVFSFTINAAAQVAAQSVWLGMNPLPSWNERSRAILQTKKISSDELKRCAVVVRKPSLLQDFLLTKMGWTLVNAAQIYGDTTVVSTAEAFDGMCRPLKFQTYVFVGKLLAGTLSPAQMDSRTDGALVNVQLTGEKNLTAEYVRYREADALCCPYKTEMVTFQIKPDGKNSLLVPEGKYESSVGSENNSNNSVDKADKLEGAIWRWTRLKMPNETVTVEKPENYTVEFMPDGKIRVQADCNRGGGSYTSDGKSLKFGAIFTTKIACPPGSLDRRFLEGLESAATFRIEGNDLFIEGDNDTMKFFRVVKQN